MHFSKPPGTHLNVMLKFSLKFKRGVIADWIVLKHLIP